ncbi:MAG: hypothetical protein L3J15_02140 [Devosiaceae bacterium]|nr:hypothetical protein [Devosiaceae bacterium]
MKCAAYLVEADETNLTAPPTISVSSLQNIAQQAKFLTINTHFSIEDIEQQTAHTPVCFILFEHTSDIMVYEELVKEIRSCKRHNIRFFPLIYLCEKPIPAVIRRCITIGFDDVIAGPFDNNPIRKRLMMQFNCEIVYFETPTYFGPDRRRHADKNLSKSSIMRGKEKCLQIKFSRNISGGISIFSRIMRAT